MIVTARMLLRDLQNMDEDVLDKPVTIYIRRKLNEDTILTARGLLIDIDDNTEHTTGNLILRVE